MKYFQLCFTSLGLALMLSSQASAQSYPPAWSSSASYSIGDQVQLAGNVLRATHAMSAGSFRYSYWELWEVRANTNIMVGIGGQFTTLASAWNYAANVRVAQGAYLHLFILNNHTENLNAPFSLNHPFGAKISIIGQNGANDVFNFTAAADGFDLDSGHTFAGLSNLTINGPAGGSSTHPAFEVQHGAYLASLSSLTIANFDLGFETDYSGEIDNITKVQLNQFLYGAAASGNGTLVFSTPMIVDGKNTTRATPAFGFSASDGGQIYAAPSSEADNCTIGFQASAGGRINANGTKVANPNGDNQYGYYSNNRGVIHADGTTVSGVGIGYYSRSGSFISAQNASASACSNWCYEAFTGGIIDGTGAMPNDNITGMTQSGPTDGSYIFIYPG